MLTPYTREKIENWVGDFVSFDRLREAPASTHEPAAAALVEFMVAACSARNAAPNDIVARDHDIEPNEIEEIDCKHALLNHAARLNVPDSAKRDLPELCAAFLAFLEDEGHSVAAGCSARTSARSRTPTNKPPPARVSP